jgi:hypothetical protein
MGRLSPSFFCMRCVSAVLVCVGAGIMNMTDFVIHHVLNVVLAAYRIVDRDGRAGIAVVVGWVFINFNYEPVRIPVGCSIFRKDVLRVSRRWGEKHYPRSATPLCRRT